MKRHSSAASLVLALLAVLGLAGPVAAEEQVPFGGSFTGVVSVFPVPNEPNLRRAEVDATGNANHLGQFTLAIPHIADFTPPPPFSSEGFYIFEAANGDTLLAEFDGKFQPIPGGFAAVEIATIIGGTGRFVGATGHFTVERVVSVDPVTGIRTTSGSFQGTVSSPGAAKR